MEANVVQVVVPCGAHWSVQVLLLLASPAKADLTDMVVSVAPVEVSAPALVPLLVVLTLVKLAGLPVTPSASVYIAWKS